MIYDFSEIKNLLRKIIEPLDHRVILPGNSEEVRCESRDDQVLVSTSGKQYLLPEEDTVTIPVSSTTAECIAEYLLGSIRKEIDDSGIKRICVKVEEGRGQGAMVSYMV